ncbi:hypothetical protein Ptr902_12056 [Pyrenophora tritici-repentis]|nr:hypothetical protein Ptr902_12056 [Pyrenophora tritici-repentis]
MEGTIYMIGSLTVVTMLFMLTIVAVPGLKERIVKLASSSFRRSLAPVLPLVESPRAQLPVLPVVQPSRVQSPVLPVVWPSRAQPDVTVVQTAQAQPEVTETPGQQKDFIQRQAEPVRDNWTQPTAVTAPPQTRLTTRDLERQRFKDKYLPRSPGKDALQDEFHRKAREGFRPNPNGYRYY